MIERLFSPQGRPRQSPADRRLVRECRRLLVTVDAAREELADALERDDVNGCKAASRRLLAVGLLLGELARYGAPVPHEEFGLSVRA